MISREPTIERLAIAKALLLTPFGLNETHLSRALGEIKAHQVDEADLYFQYTRSEGWSLEEGIVKTGSFSIDQGVGVRAVSGEKTAFAYSDDISNASLLDAARTVRAISSAATGAKNRMPARKVAGSRALYPDLDPITTLDSTTKVELLGKVEKLARGRDPRVVQVMAGLASEYDVVLVARADGTLAADVRPLVRLSVTVIAEQKGTRPLRWDRDQFRRAAELGYFNGLRVELVRGNAVVMSPKGWPHVAGCRNNAVVLEGVFAGVAWVSRQDPVALLDQEPEPDAAVIPGRFGDPADHPTTALLVVEVSDTTLDYDLTTKAELYAEAGIADYWVLDVVNRALHVLRDPQPVTADGHSYRSQAVLGPADAAAPLAAPGAAVRVADLLP